MKRSPVQIAQMVIDELLAKQAIAQADGQYTYRDYLGDQITGAQRVLCALRDSTYHTCDGSEPEFQ